jgi:hypothetical protein
VRLGRRFNAWRAETFHDAEINEIYGVRSDQPLAAYTQHPEEIDELVRVNVDAALKLFSNETHALEALSLPRDAESTRTVRLGLADFVDMSDDYAVQTLRSIRQLAHGAAPAPFTIRSNE